MHREQGGQRINTCSLGRAARYSTSRNSRIPDASRGSMHGQVGRPSVRSGAVLIESATCSPTRTYRTGFQWHVSAGRTTGGGRILVVLVKQRTAVPRRQRTTSPCRLEAVTDEGNILCRSAHGGRTTDATWTIGEKSALADMIAGVPSEGVDRRFAMVHYSSDVQRYAKEIEKERKSID